MLAAAFAEPVDAAQRHFRALLEALSRPGRPVALAGELPPAPLGLTPASYAVALTLLDYETPLWLDPALATAGTIDALRFHCGCPIVASPGAAAFALLSAPAAALPLGRFGVGTPDYPDRAATLIVQVEGFTDGPTARLSGPGIEVPLVQRVAGAPPDFWPALAANHAGFPAGVDLVLATRERISGLPRSTAVEPC